VLLLGEYNDAISLVKVNGHQMAALNLILNGEVLQACRTTGLHNVVMTFNTRKMLHGINILIIPLS
jgi:hypothetical protein